MNIVLWILQALLALHTVIGAGWKLFNSEQAVPTLTAIPSVVWMGLIPFELLCAAGLVAPVVAASLGWLVPIAAIGIAVEMLVFSGVHLCSGAIVLLAGCRSRLRVDRARTVLHRTALRTSTG